VEEAVPWLDMSHYSGNGVAMVLSTSKITAQGQVSVPVEVRRVLGVGPGARLDWEERDGEIRVRRSSTHSCEDIHRSIFGNQRPEAKTSPELKDGIREHVRKRHARN
jgi:AbrB family looped-hinge helix DNA binding protein